MRQVMPHIILVIRRAITVGAASDSIRSNHISGAWIMQRFLQQRFYSLSISGGMEPRGGNIRREAAKVHEYFKPILHLDRKFSALFLNVNNLFKILRITNNSINYQQRDCLSFRSRKLGWSLSTGCALDLSINRGDLSFLVAIHLMGHTKLRDLHNVATCSY